MNAFTVAALPYLRSALQQRPWKVAAHLHFAPINGDVEIQTHHCDRGEDKLILFLCGAHSYGHLVWHQIEPYSRGIADTAVATYNVQAFNAAAIVRSLADYVGTQYSDVTFVCASLGGLIGYDTLVELRRRHGIRHHAHFKLIDSPSRFGNINLRGAMRTIGGECGTLTRQTVQQLRHHTEALPVIGNIVSETEMLLQLEAQAGRAFPLAGFARQVQYLRRHRGIDPEVLQGCSGEFYRSDQDTVVLETAYDNWSEAFGYRLPYHIVSDSKHVDLVRNAQHYGSTLALAA